MTTRSKAIRISDFVALLPKQILSFTVFKWTFPLSILLAVVSTPDRIESGFEVLIWLSIGVLAHLSMLPFVIYGRGKDFKEQFLLVLLMGFTRGAVLSVLAPLFGVNDALEPAQRILNSTVAVFYWSQAGAIVVEYGTEFRQRLHVLLNEVLEKNIVGLPEAAKKSQNVVLEIIGHLQERIVDTVGNNPTKEKLQNTSREIDALINDHIKPLSQSRWKDGELIWVRAGFFAVLRRTLTLNPLPIFAVIVLTWPFTIIAQVSRIGILQTIQVQVVWTTLVIGIALVTYRDEPKNSSYLGQNLKLFSLLPFAYFATFVVQLISPLQNNATLLDMLRGYALSIVTQVAAYLVGVLLLSLHRDQEFVFDFISDLIKAGELEQFLNKTKSGNLDASYAQYLHAEVQSQLLACKLLLLKAAESDFKLFPPEVTKQIVERMERLKQPYERPVARVPAQRIAELKDSWAGLAEITYQLPPELSELHSYSDVTSQLIEESVVNSIRHGKATKICITAEFRGNTVAIEVGDNGQIKPSMSSRGLGSILFDTFAAEWNLRREGSSTVVAFSIDTKGLR